MSGDSTATRIAITGQHDLLAESVSEHRTPAWVLAVVLLAALAAAMPYVGSRFEYLPGDLYDARLNLYFLEHGYKWISGQTGHSFLDAPFFYPVRRVLAYSDNLAGSLPFYVPWRWLGFDRE